MSVICRLICRIFGHTTHPGVSAEWSVYYHCPRCLRLVPGGLSKERAS